MLFSDRRTDRTGFTLTELLVVVVLMAVLAGVMMAEMRGTFDDALLRGTARDLMSGLAIASSRAVTLAQAQVFRLEPAEHKFLVHAANLNPAAGPEPRSAQVEERKLDERVEIEIRDPSRVPEEEEMEAPEQPALGQPASGQPIQRDVIRFYPDGTADRREIVLRDRAGIEMFLRINPVTGRVRIASEELEE